jgi:hypothetical protein
MAKISISYRRRDSDAITGRIFDRLVAHYGADAVFRDIDNIPPGIDFRKYISSALESTDILLAIVGPQWAGKVDGRTRIQEVTDLVRIEIEAALRKDIPVVPVLVGAANMPDPGELPDGLKDFAFRNAVKVDALEDFEDHVKRLIRSLDRVLEAQAVAREPIAAPALEPALEPPREREALPGQAPADPSIAIEPFGKTPANQPGPPAQKIAPPTTPVEAEAARTVLDRTSPPPRKAGPADDLQAGTSVGPLLILPGIVIVVYVALYLSGIWNLGRTSLYTPASPLAQAGLFAFCVSQYGRVAAARSLLGGAALWLASSAVSLANGAMTSVIVANTMASDRALYFILMGGVVSALLATAIMAIGTPLCPVLRRRRYWLIALIGYPLFSLGINALVPLLLSPGFNQSSIAAIFFAAGVVRQVVIFACLGFWVSQPYRSAETRHSRGRGGT